MKTIRALFLLITLIITIRAGFAQEVPGKIECPNLVKNGDFEDGPTGFKSDFIYVDIYADTSSLHYLIRGYYSIIEKTNRNGYYYYSDPVPNTGKYYIISVDNSGKRRLWYDSITVKPNTTYSFSCILANINLVMIENPSSAYYTPGVMSLKVNGKNICPAKQLSNGHAWTPFKIKYKTGTEETRIEIAIVNEIWTGNEVALDNIVFKEIPPEEFTSDCKVKFPRSTERIK
jgi:hypothetical protein